ncbi:hypothetical protein Cgig2_030937 [Carnegiea gigantea]|uniref:Uncharacterized protein n=1 Tax=Carnegiea gigantea TaxID=171969 RepID=A0A9Q1GHI1_9CARY|nr:hypothetical protein Cgig2_030937 [Carnegiea gigantea]
MSKFRGLDGGIKCDCWGYRFSLIIPSVAFPRFLSTREMVEYVVYHFEWYRLGVAFPKSPLPKDFQTLYPSYELTMAEEVVGRFELLELPQVIFYAMLMNKAVKLGVLHGRTLREMEHLSFHKGAVLTGEKRGKESSVRSPLPFIMAFPPLYDSMEMVDYVRESFIWCWRRATCLPRPLLEDYCDLCSRFSLPEAKRAAADFELPEMVQATFHAMLLNDAVELGVVRGFIADDLKSTLVGLRWTCFEAWMSRTSHELREPQLRQRTVVVEARGRSDSWEESSGSTGPPPPLVTRSSQNFMLKEPSGKVGVAGCSLRGCIPLEIILFSL